ncbi:MAG: superoxide dismutase [Chlamydiales bacterium]|nr:superoxide dismutase [Chlamydiales bacterium]
MRKLLLLATLIGLPLITSFVGEVKGVVPPKAYVAKDYSKLFGMPGFSEKALSMHFKLYQGYVKTTNDFLSKLEELRTNGKERSLEFSEFKRRLMWDFDGMRLHELYFDNLGGHGSAMDKENLLYKQISADFGSFEAWRRDFKATGAMRGFGWAILYRDSNTGRLINTWINEHDTGHLAGGTPLLVMDVFEHAYMLDYGLDRNAYIDAFFDNINWPTVEKRFPGR